MAATDTTEQEGGPDRPPISESARDHRAFAELAEPHGQRHALSASHPPIDVFHFNGGFVDEAFREAGA